jgi:hypothetical protein
VGSISVLWRPGATVPVPPPLKSGPRSDCVLSAPKTKSFYGSGILLQNAIFLGYDLGLEVI